MAVHGHPRYTKDLDLWVLAEVNNAKNLISAMDEFGFGSLDLTKDDFISTGYVVQLGQPPARIDLLTSLTGVEFEACWENRLTLEDDGLILPVIALNDLITNKKVLGRYQDLADIEELRRQ